MYLHLRVKGALQQDEILNNQLYTAMEDIFLSEERKQITTKGNKGTGEKEKSKNHFFRCFILFFLVLFFLLPRKQKKKEQKLLSCSCVLFSFFFLVLWLFHFFLFSFSFFYLFSEKTTNLKLEFPKYVRHFSIHDLQFYMFLQVLKMNHDLKGKIRKKKRIALRRREEIDYTLYRNKIKSKRKRQRRQSERP